MASAAEGIFGVTRIPFDKERQTLKKYLNIPSDSEVPCFIALGYPAESAQRARQRSIEAKDKIHTDGW